MKIKWGALVVDGRGKLGGHVAAQNKGGSYLRTKVTPANPQTTFQTSIRSLFGSISQQWSALTAANITAWNAAVDSWKQTNIFGDIKLPSGKALFQRLNTQARAVEYSAMTSPPAKLEMVEGVLTDASLGITAETLTLTGAYTGTDAKVVLSSSGSVSLGTTFVKNLLRQFNYQLGSTYVAADAYTAYVARFGDPVIGQKIYIGVKYVLPNGQASVRQSIQATIVA